MGAKQYSIEYKKEALKLVNEVGTTKAMEELGIPKGTLYGWIAKEKRGEIDLGIGTRSPSDTLSLAEEVKQLRKQVKDYEKEIARINKLNTFLDEASRFFASSRQK